MEVGYRIVIQGARTGFGDELVAQALAPLLKHPAEQLLPALRARNAIRLSLKGLPLAAARAFKETVDKTGADCTLESTAPLPPPAAVLPAPFSAPPLRPFVSRAAGLVLNAPVDWRDISDDLFQVQQTGASATFSASLNPRPGVGLAVWAEIRFGVLPDKMPYLRLHRAPYSLDTAAGPAIGAEFRGLVPGDQQPSHQLVLCLCPDAGAISVNITAAVPDFEQHQALYQWLLRTQLHLLSAARDLATREQDFPQAQHDTAVKLAKAGNMQAAAEWFRKAAQQGLAQAQFDLGGCYQRGDGVAQSDRQAFEWWHKAAEQGHRSAQFNLASMYERGIATAPDLQRSFHWRLKAAEQGDATAQYLVAVCYVKGTGVAADLDQAAQWTLKAAEQGYANAQFYAGAMHEGGEGLPQDNRRAIAWYRQAAAQGHQGAQQRLQVLGG